MHFNQWNLFGLQITYYYELQKYEANGYKDDLDLVIIMDDFRVSLPTWSDVQRKYSSKARLPYIRREIYGQESYDIPAPESHPEMEEAAQWNAGKHMLNPSAYCVPQQACYTSSEVASRVQILSLAPPAVASLLLPLTPVQLPFQKWLSLTSSSTYEHPELSTVNIYPVSTSKVHTNITILGIHISSTSISHRFNQIKLQLSNNAYQT